MVALAVIFDAYDSAILRYVQSQEQHGRPVAAEWSLVCDASDSPDTADLVTLSNAAIGITLGWDFKPWSAPQGDLTTNAAMQPGNIRAVPNVSATRALLGATRDALSAAIDAGNVDAVAGPINAFWATHPNYHPNHGGRCYPHGHAYNPYPSVAACQIHELKAMLALHTPGAVLGQ